jgi:hypothetical protein
MRWELSVIARARRARGNLSPIARAKVALVRYATLAMTGKDET